MTKDQPKDRAKGKPQGQPAEKDFTTPEEQRGENWVRFDLPAGATLDDINALLEQLKGLNKTNKPKSAGEEK